jgi:hypothetical protein
MKKSNKLSRGGAGGGPGSRQHVRTSVRTGAARQHMHPGGVAQLGQHVGSHTPRNPDTGYRGERLTGPTKPISVELGNANALKGIGVGGGRTVYKSGSQQGLQSAKPLPKGVDIVSLAKPRS